MHIDEFSLHTIYNSRVQPTVEAVINDHAAAAPSGASTGTHEAACFVPDNLADIEQELRAKLEGQELTQEELDQVLKETDGTDSFDNIGAVAIATSLAFQKAAGFDYPENPTFPYPAGNLVGGGAHGGNTTIQEFLVIPTAAESIPEAMQILADMYHAFKDRYGQRIKGVNDEGAYVTNMNDEETLDAVKTVADEHGADVGIDAAATEYYNAEDATYEYPGMNMALNAQQQAKFMATLVDRFDLVYVEDPFDEEDYESFAALTEDTDTLVVGDDLFVTNEQRLQHGIDIGAGNAIIVKPNQVGTVTDTKATFDLAQDNGYTPIISHRSGETCDPAIANLAVAWGAPLLKAGIAGIRTAKNNELLRLWGRLDGEMADPAF